MTLPPYLDMLDELLRPGLASLSKRFVETQIGFVVSRQQSDGGFSGRQGGSDSYYSDFALRTLAWLAPNHPALRRCSGYIAGRQFPPRDIVECFSFLNARRLLERHCAHDADTSHAGHASWDGVAAPQAPPLDRMGLTEWLYGQILPGGGFSRLTNDHRVSAYHTFLGGLCFEMLGVHMPASDDARNAIEALHRPDGGYAELSGQRESQTNATAAAIAFLMKYDGLPPDTMQTARHLASMQGADGGLKAHAAAGGGDLLSTFTGLLTLLGLDGLHHLDSAAAARFLRNAAHHGGGFRASFVDDAADVEYTYYGIGTLAILRLAASPPE